MKLGLRGIDEQKVADACSSLGHDVVLDILQKMVEEGPRKNGEIIELRITQFSRMIKAKIRQDAEQSKSEAFLKSQGEQKEVRDKQRGSGFQPNAETLRAIIERMYIQSGEISTAEYESAMNFLGVPVEERQVDFAESDIQF